MPLGKVLIQVFSLKLWIISMANWLFTHEMESGPITDPKKEGLG